MTVEVVHDDDISRLQSRQQDLIDVSLKAQAIDRPVNDTRRCQAITAQCREEGQGFPMPMWELGLERKAAFAPAAKPRHVGLDPGLINEDQTRGINTALILLPPISPSGDVRTVLLAWQNGFF